MKTEKKRRRMPSVQRRLTISLALFVVVILGIFWLLETVFLDDCYVLIKRISLERAADVFERCLSDEEQRNAMADYCIQNGIFAVIMDEDGKIILQSDPSNIKNDLYGVNYFDMVTLIMRANTNNGSAYETYTSREIAVPQSQMGEEVFSLRDARMARFEGMVYVRLAEHNGQTAAIALNTEITPLDATINTLRVQLGAMSIIVLIMAVILGIALSNTISRPIAAVNRAAKALSAGEYTEPRKRGSYREINELNETLHTAAQELSRTETMRRELLANVSHDLRTPLTMINGYAQMMVDIPGENNAENAQIIVEESDRLTSLVNDILDVSRYTAGNQKLEQEDYNLTADIRQVLTRYARLAGEGYSVSFQAEQDVWIHGDCARLQQVIYNLVNNALQYTLDKTVSVTQTVREKRVRIEVTDHGEGIPEEDLPLIWDRYYKVDRTHKRAEVGTGLGLSIVHSILELHGATFGVRSTLGEGSTFWFELPALKTPETE